MAEKSYNEIPDLNEDWGLDPRNGLKYSGRSVQDFIKRMIREVIAETGSKFGDVVYEGGAIRFYDEDGGTQLKVVTITGTSYSVNVETNMPSSNITILTSDETFPITLTPTTKSMEFGSAEQDDYPEDYTFMLQVDNGSGYVDRTPENNIIRQGSTASVDIRPYVKVGTNRVRIVVTGSSSEQPKTLGYSVTLTSLSLSCNHPWHKAWIQGQEFAITNIFFSGNIAKTIHVKVGESVYTKDYSASTSYDKVPTTFDLTNTTPPASGVVPVEMWMTGDGVETKHIHYNIMYVSSEDVGRISLICTNNVKQTAYNFTEEQLLEYAVYGINSLTTSVVASFKDTSVDVLPAMTQNVIAQTAYQLKLSLQIDTVESQGISLQVNLSSDTASVTENISVDNSNAYLATEGYKFYLNTSLGNNDSADREILQNSAILQDGNYKAAYTASWNNFTFADDAWGRDTDGNRALVVKAGSELKVTDLKPLQYSNTKSATFEFMFRASNIADYNTPIITCMDTEEYTPQSVGFIVFPTRVVLLGTGIRQELFQQLPLSEDRIHHIGIVIQRGYAASALNIARIYINGCENVTFSFSGGNLFYNSSGINSLRVGQQSTDTYLYMMRIYDVALEANQMFANYLNALIETAETSRKGLREDNNITDGTSISYDLCKKAGFNCLVIEIEGDKPIPSLTNPVEYSSGCNYHFEYNDTPEWNVSIYDAPMDRQGTTSSLYFYSNLRSKIKNPLRWVYPNLKDAQGKVLEEIGKDGYIAGYGLNPKVSRITWKKNIASQPQGHKMGATMMYTAIYKRIMGGAEKLVADKILPTTGARVSVYQHPFMTFQRFSDGTETFIGLMTGGPDKADKKTFGYNATDEYPSLMMIEGPNHDPYMTRFLVPWTDDVFYDYQAETLSVGAQSAADGSKQEGWDADIVAGYSSDDANDAQAIFNLYKSEFKPAYDAVYYNSPYIASLAECGKTLSEINADVAVFQRGTTRGYSNTLMTFYDAEYNLVYYRVKTGKYEVLDKSVHDMPAYLGLSGTPTTEEILAARDAQWIQKISAVVNMREAYYRQIFDEFIGASDNDAKNSYWRKFLSVADGGKWGFNEDDLDTIFQNDNNGQDTKSYFVEPDDTSSLGADIFQGRTSAFWFALRRNCKEQLRGMMREFVDAMYAEAESKGLIGSTVHQTVYNLIDYYFWRHSSKYFPATAYNQDTQFAYIDVWYQDPDAVYNNVPPLTQIHGDHYETEREWVSKRIPYMFSKYQIAAFEAGAADGYGSLEFTPAEGHTMEVVPAIDLYPRVSYGGSETQNSQRTKAGDTCPLVLSASGTTGNYIKGMDWLSDLGDLSDLKLSPRSAADAAISFSVKGKRLRRLKVGDENKTAEEIKFNAASLGVESEALELLDARNASTIEGSVSLAKCPRISEAYFRGTNLKSVIPPTGGRLTTLQMPESLQDLILHSLNLLHIEGLDIPESALANIRNLYINSCKHINPVDLLKRIYETPDNKLTAIGLIWKGTLVDEDGSFMRMFGKIAEKAGQDGGYSGVDFTNDITPMTMPNVSGALDATGLKGVYQEDIDNILAKLPNLLLSYNADNLYISFDDEEVLSVLLANGVGDGVGITKEAAEKVTSIGTWFKDNTTIKSFDEFEKFTGVTAISSSQNNHYHTPFEGCANLKSIKLPNGLTTIGYYCFYNCNSLTDVSFVDSITHIYGGSFVGTALQGEIVLPNAIYIDGFSGTNIEKFTAESIVSFVSSVFYNCLNLKEVSFASLEKIPNANNYSQGMFQNCSNLTKVNIPSITSIGTNAFYNCTSLEFEDLSLLNLEILGQNAFYGVKVEKISNLGKLTTLPVAAAATQNYGDKSVLKEITFPESLKVIPDYSLYNYAVLTKASLPSSITNIGVSAFQHCNSLEIDINLPNLESLGTCAFCSNRIKKVLNLGKITALPNSTTSAKGVFGVELEEIVLPNTLKEIKQYSLYGCSNLISINLSSSLEIIGMSALHGCSSLSIDELSLPNLTSLGQNAFSDVKIKKISNLGKITTLPTPTSNAQNFGDKGVLEEVVLPDTVTALESYAFYGYTTLKTINLDSISIMNGHYHFKNCTSLEGDIVLPTTRIGGESFLGTKITSIYCPNIETIDFDAFENCRSLKIAHFGSNLTTIGAQIFLNCSALEAVIIEAETPPTVGVLIFKGASSCPIYVPDSSVAAYREASGWMDYADRINPLSEYDVRILTYNEDGNGGYKLYKISEYDTTKNESVMGVAVHGNNGDFVMNKNAVQGGNPWVETGEIKDLVNHLGYSNTKKMLEAYPNGDNEYVHNKCSQTIFVDGSEGYLMSYGEAMDVWRRKDAVFNAMNKIGGTFSTSGSQWLSSNGHAGNKWMGRIIFSGTTESEAAQATGSFGAALSYNNNPITRLPQGIEW